MLTLFKNIYLPYLKSLIKTSPKQWKVLFNVRKNTYVNPDHLALLINIVKKIHQDNIPGDFVECGVWKGGCVAIMQYAQSDKKKKRKLWLFDSFEGMPEPLAKEDGVKATNYSKNRATGKLSAIDTCVAHEDDVINLFNQLNLTVKNVEIVKGWFQNTVPKKSKKIPKISILRLDGDWYESTKICLDYLYPNLSKNGYLIIDDYYRWEGCKKAVDEYFEKHKLTPDFTNTGEFGVIFQKSD